MEINQEVQRIDTALFAKDIERIKEQIKNLVIGQEQSIDLLLTALVANGHVLLEGVPGIAKTLLAKTLSNLINTEFKRIQFTPDLMPADIIGTSVYNAQNSEFEFKKGPLFSNVVLIDEINRSPAKTQAALFEAMEERNITVDGTTYRLEDPFLVLATQNPVDQEGTYRLPEAQLDRFLFKIQMDFPSLDEELAILMRFNEKTSSDLLKEVEPVLSVENLLKLRAEAEKVHVEEPLMKYIANIVHRTRNTPDIYLGASPRASLAILRTAKAFAAINGRDFITPDDVQFVAVPALIHRIIPSAEKEIEGITARDIVQSVIKSVEVPR